jgi:hypothetical protein
MHLFKFKIVIFCFLIIEQVFGFTSNECLRKSFEVNVNHKDFPFGLLDVKIGIEKEGCNLTINHQKFKYMTSQWSIDVCRGPVHIKKGTGAIDVIKKTNNCSDASKDNFCLELKDLSVKIQDDALIFAEGIKENLSTDHGKAYCSFLLLQRYLGDSIVFNSENDYEDNLELLKGVKKKLEVKELNEIPRPVMEEGTQVQMESEEESPVEKPSTGEGSF